MRGIRQIRPTAPGDPPSSRLNVDGRPSHFQQSRGRLLLAFGFLLLLLGAVRPVCGQTAAVAVAQANFRQQPEGGTPGKKLATVMQGTPLQVEGRQGSWRKVTLEGWIWTPSVGATDQDGFDLVVTKDGGENLRAKPNGEVRAVLLKGFLLQKTGQVGSWTEVERTGWIWGPSLKEAAGDAASPRAQAGGAGRPVRSASPSSAGAPDHVVVGQGPARILVSPDGDTAAVARPGTDLQILARKGNWTRVRLDGWVWAPSVMPADSGAASADLTVADLKANPEQYRGRRVRWQVQFVSLEHAEAVRSDFYEGEPFMLTRAEDASQGFVYIAVPPELVPAVEKLQSLQRVTVLARVRTGRSALMGVPILDLLALEGT